jgi:hypothetical protein
VENEENQTQVSHRFPQPLEIAARFPHSHRSGGVCISGKKQIQKPKKGAQLSARLNFNPFRLILGLENAGIELSNAR